MENHRQLLPLNDCVLIDPDPPPDYAQYKQYQHVVIPDRYIHGPEDRPVWGTVVTTGGACRAAIRLGDHVVFGKWAGARVSYQNKAVILVRADELLAVDTYE